MSDLTTRCPCCHVTFQPSSAQLQAASGLVRCGACLTAFNALVYAIPEPQQPEPAAPQQPAENPAEIDMEDDFLIHDDMDMSAIEKVEQQISQSASTEEATTIPEDIAEPPATEHEDNMLHETAEPADSADHSSSILPDQNSAFVAPDSDAPTANVAESHTDQLPEEISPENGSPSKQQDKQPVKQTCLLELVPTDLSIIPLKKTPAQEASPNQEDSPEPIPSTESTQPAESVAPEETEQSDGQTVSSMPQEPNWDIDIPVNISLPPYTTEIGEAIEADFNPNPERQPATNGRNLRWSALALAAGLAIGIQYLYFHVDTLGANQENRRWLNQFCQLLPCEVAPLVDKSLIKSTKLLIHSHPDRPNALTVDAVIINYAPFDQPFTDLLLTFEDLQGEIVAQRRFEPRDYLYGELTGAVVMPSRQPVRLSLEILDPGPAAVNFSLYIPE